MFSGDSEPQRPSEFVPLPAERWSGIEYALRTYLSNSVTQIGQADMKASVVVSTTSIVLSIITATWDGQAEFRSVLAIGAIGATVALMSALAVLFPRGVGVHAALDSDRVFFSARIANQTVEEFLSEATLSLSGDHDMYQNLLRDLHGQSTILVRGKYKWLRIAYTALFLTPLCGLIAALVVTVAG